MQGGAAAREDRRHGQGWLEDALSLDVAALPDGGLLAFLSGRVSDPIRFTVREGETSLWVIRPDGGGGAVRLTAGADLREVAPVWTGQGIFVIGRSLDRAGAAHTEVWRVDPR